MAHNTILPARQEYYLGLDIGTDSVGYAVTNLEYDLLKCKGAPAWGVNLFDSAKLNTERRAYRTARRRLDRRQQRVSLVQELFAAEIAKVDPHFYIRLQKSALYRDEAEAPFTLFNDPDYTDREYHNQYPTIHHLLVDLMNSEKPHDVRLVYLACAWLVAHRGHFLNGIAKENLSVITEFSQVYSNFMSFFASNGYTPPWKDSDAIKAMNTALRSADPVGQKYKALATACFGKSAPKEHSNTFPYNCDVLFRGLCGSKISAEKLFFKSEYGAIKSFTLGDSEDTLAEVTAQLGDDAELISAMKSVYDWALLVDILKEKPSISEAKCAIYEQHRNDLTHLKRFIRKYRSDRYRTLFRETDGSGYAAYVYHSDKPALKKRASREDFYKLLRNTIKGIEPEAEDMLFFEDMQRRLNLNTFLPKQRDTDNRVIPYQLYWYELDLILKNAERYLLFLKNTEGGLSVSDKLRCIFCFRIPYFVGPLNSASDKAWVVWTDKKAGRVLPWNFNEVVDLDASEQAFIRRMTNTCTYLPGEAVLPKDSLPYHRFEVLNEINNITINGEHITVAEKQALYAGVFEAYRKPTRKRIEDWLISNNIMREGDLLAGIDEQLKSNLKPQHDFRRLLDAGVLSTQDIETIIERSTYSEDRPRFLKWLHAHYLTLSEDDLAYISRLRYKDFGRLSARFLNGLEGANRQTGELFTILGALWNTNCSLMSLLSDQYTFIDEIREAQQAYYAAHPRSMLARLDDMYVSNAVKRPVLRAMEIVSEVTKAFDGAPKRIFVEMARGGTAQQKGKRTLTRREQLLQLYERQAEEDVRALRKELEAMGDQADNRLQSDRLYLYYMQLGRCLYSNDAISIEQLSGSQYNIEHIYPRSVVKDDSLQNNMILVRSEINGAKGNQFPVPADIQSRMRPIWHRLHKNGLLSDEKLRRLTRTTPFDDNEKWGFINRQLTETTQSTKAVATLLRERYPETEIVYVKARLTSEFRQDFDCIKSRSYNDLHHAKDAYLNIVTGNVYHMRFSKRWFVPRDHSYNVKAKALFSNPVICGDVTVWRGAPDLAKVKATISKNTGHVTHYAFCRHGGLFDQQPLKAAPGLISLKANKPVERYGGYNKSTASFFLLVHYRSGKKTDLMFMPVELMSVDKVLQDEAFRQQYALNTISRIIRKPVQEVSFPLGKRIIRVNTVLMLDGYKVCIRSKSSGGRNISVSSLTRFSASMETERYLKRLESFCEKYSKNNRLVCSPEYDRITVEDNLALYDLYIEKLTTSIYRKRINNPVELLRKGRESFTLLPLEAQAKTLLNIHAVFGRLTNDCDLSQIGAGSRAAATVGLSSSLSNWKKNYSKVYILDESTSGLWCRRSQNLLELL